MDKLHNSLSVDYETVLSWLRERSDADYKAFNDKLMPGEENTLGVRMPELRRIAKAVLRSDWRAFLYEQQAEEPHELILIRCMVTGGAKCSYEEKLRHVEKLLPKLRNWAQVDTLACCLKDASSHLPETYAFLLPYFSATEEYNLRFAVVMLLSYFRTDEYIDRVLSVLANVQHEGYYVKVAVAWAVSFCFISHRDETLMLLERGELEDFTHNRSIQKIIESYRVQETDKAMLKHLKRKPARTKREA